MKIASNAGRQSISVKYEMISRIRLWGCLPLLLVAPSLFAQIPSIGTDLSGFNASRPNKYRHDSLEKAVLNVQKFLKEKDYDSSYRIMASGVKGPRDYWKKEKKCFERIPDLAWKVIELLEDLRSMNQETIRGLQALYPSHFDEVSQKSSVNFVEQIQKKAESKSIVFFLIRGNDTELPSSIPNAPRSIKGKLWTRNVLVVPVVPDENKVHDDEIIRWLALQMPFNDVNEDDYWLKKKNPKVSLAFQEQYQMVQPSNLEEIGYRKDVIWYQRLDLFESWAKGDSGKLLEKEIWAVIKVAALDPHPALRSAAVSALQARADSFTKAQLESLQDIVNREPAPYVRRYMRALIRSISLSSPANS